MGLEKKITIRDRRLLFRLISNKGCKSTNRLAELEGINWNTADEHINKLFRFGLVKKCLVHRHPSGQSYWRLNRY